MEKTETKGGIARFKEMSENYRDNPKILNKIIQNMVEKIEELEIDLKIATTRANALQNAFDRCEAKASAYDRLMSGGKKTLKEWANIFGMPFALGYSDQAFAFKCKKLPEIFGNVWFPTGVDDYVAGVIGKEFIEYSGDWKDSLTLPDGWEADHAR